jgi:GH24 family phage-related lysozyme (muramidase)
MLEQDQAVDFEEYEAVEIEHPLHGMLEFDVPMGMSDEDVLVEFDKLDLDLMLGLEQVNETEVGGTQVEKLKEFENSAGAGLRGGKWYGHQSLEGGTDTIAYGHKLTSDEASSGFIDIDGELVDFTKGLTQEQAEYVLNKDVKWAKTHAVASLKKVGMENDEGKVSALTSLIYNVGSGAWGSSKAKKHLEAGSVEDFMHEAFSEEVGFVKINGDKSRGLVRRRAEEARLFAQANIDEGGSFSKMIMDTLASLSPVSAAQAADDTKGLPKPTQEALDRATAALNGLNGGTAQPTLRSGSKDKENVGVLQDMLGMETGGDRGIFGPKTMKAVQAFQEANGLEADGIVGKGTWAKLQEGGGESILDAFSLEGFTDTAKDMWKDFTKVEPGMKSVPIPSRFKLFANHVQGYTGVVKEDMLSKEEHTFMKDVAVKRIKEGGAGISYKHLSKNAGKDISYSSDVKFTSSMGDNIKLTIGKADIVLHNGQVMIADEYDLTGEGSKMKDASLVEKLEYIAGATGTQGKAHRYGEVFGAGEGEGMSQRYSLGTPEELGLTAEDVSHLKSLEEYEAGKIRGGLMNPANKAAQ